MVYSSKFRAWVLVGIMLVALAARCGAAERYAFQRMWPTLPQPWYFHQPWGIGIDGDDYLYVADAFNHRVQKYTPGGHFVTAWGREGTGAGEFRFPYDVVVSLEGWVYVLDSENLRIQKFDSTGRYLEEWAVGEAKTSHLEGLGIDWAGLIYVADGGRNLVYVYTGEGELRQEWGLGGVVFQEPIDVAVQKDGTVLVLEREGSAVSMLDGTGMLLGRWGGGERPGTGRVRSAAEHRHRA